MADEPIPIRPPENTSGDERATPDNADGRGISRVRRNKGPRIDIGAGGSGRETPDPAISGSRVAESPQQVWGRIWHEFSERRARDRNGAHMGLITNIADNAADLSGMFQNPKDFVDTIIHLEGFVKESSGAKEGAAIDYVSSFLKTGEVTHAPKKAN
jgi:hypothetical protein